MIDINVEIPPLSVNKAFQGRRFNTPLYKQWLKDGLLILPKHEMMIGYVEVWLSFGMINFKRSDADNPVKTIFDLIVKRGYIKDDCQIIDFHVHKEKTDKPFIKIKIMELTPLTY